VTVELHPFSIAFGRSDDAGAHWGISTTLYAADSNPENGCWEPTAIQLPSGELQVYFANERPYRDSAEQEITLLRSFDGGESWGEPETVSFRAGFRDGMPSPLLLNDGKGIALAIEDNGFNGNLQPAIVLTSLEDNWHSGSVGGDSPRRWGALNPQIPSGAYAGAPSLRQLPSGPTLLSFQQDDSGDLWKSQMVVCIGDANARNFAHPSHPFPITTGTPQLWNSLFVKNATTVTALSSTTIDGVYGVWSIDGNIE